jgi:hypothetical protein
MNKEYIVGTFEVTSGTLIVSDPCYSRRTWCMGQLENVKKGTWIATVSRGTVGGWGTRNAELTIQHSNFEKESHEPETVASFEVGVDSGQAGFFDDCSYPLSIREQGDYGKPDTFYGKVCIGTLDSRLSADIVDNAGVVSSSGFGDGGYVCLVTRNAEGEVIKSRIVFISEHEDRSVEVQPEA